MDESMKINELGEFPAFTILFQYCRPKESDFIVYAVDAGLPTDHNLSLTAAKFEENKMVGDPSELIVSKEWVLENLEKILANVPDPETTRT
jgi:hypothetical protein